MIIYIPQIFIIIIYYYYTKGEKGDGDE